MTIMDADDKKLINLLQQGLPLEEDPYAIIAGTINKSKSEILARIKELSQAGYIRRLGGTFDNNTMGFNSMLIGAHVPEKIFYEVAEYINSYNNVTHNYRRPAYLNMWFTFTSKNEETRTAFIKALKENFAIEDVLEFPNLKNFKLHVFFDMESR